MPGTPRPLLRREGRPTVLVLALAALALVAAPMSASAQEPGAPEDAARMLSELQERQAGFESFRESRIPPRTRPGASRCDERIGRICHWFGGADEADFPPEPVETEMARRQLIGELFDGWTQLHDPWILGQLVRYLAEEDRLGEARALAAECGLSDPWWCHALEGYLLHLDGEFPGAQEAFEEALHLLPEEEAAAWRTPRYILSPALQEAFERAGPEEQEVLWGRLWRLSDPLLLVDGNDRLTEHYARLVEARFFRESTNTFQIPWDVDLGEGLIRYGRTTGWSRIRSAPGGSRQLEDTRNIVGHHHPGSRGYLFPEEFLEAPADVPPEAWITGPREARTWYAAPYAPDFRGLETQVARFRERDSILVVGAFRPDPGSLAAGALEFVDEPDDPFGRAGDPFRGGNPFAGGDPEEADLPTGEEVDPGAGDSHEVETGFFLIPEVGGPPLSALAATRDGVLTLRAPSGRYVSSLEVLDRGAGAAWRARQGVTATPITRGLAGLSDLLILREDAPLPETLEEAIPLARPGVRVRRDERFAVSWEVYGLAVQETARITLGFTRGRPGFLQRVGEFLGVLEPDAPVEVQFDETAMDDVQTLFRAVHLTLPDLEPGEYTLHLRLELPGREPAVASRPIVVEP